MFFKIYLCGYMYCSSSLFIAEYIVILSIYLSNLSFHTHIHRSLFIHSPLDGYLDCFHVLVIIILPGPFNCKSFDIGFHFSWVKSKEQDCWITQAVYVYKKLPSCFPKWRCYFTISLAVYDDFLFKEITLLVAWN